MNLFYTDLDVCQPDEIIGTLATYPGVFTRCLTPDAPFPCYRFVGHFDDLLRLAVEVFGMDPEADRPQDGIYSLTDRTTEHPGGQSQVQQVTDDPAEDATSKVEPIPKWACAGCRHPFYEHRESTEYRLLNARTPAGATGCVHSGCGCTKADESHLA
ncbi:MAG: hypothetical protein KGH75_00330 [Rhodospirillales bacterium]|nr:hypothetical protein [Rhodospirillales bacterium]